APQVERGAQTAFRLGELTVAQRSLTLARPGREAERVDRLAADRQHVPGTPTDHRVGTAEDPPQRGDLPAQGPGTVGRSVAPGDVAPAVVAHNLPAAQREADQQARQPRATHRDEAPAIVDDLQGTENADLHGTSSPSGRRRHSPELPASVTPRPR